MKIFSFSKLGSLSALLFFSVMTFAQPAGYYQTANGLTGTQLKLALHDIIDGHHSISYSDIWDAFWSTDNKGNGIVWDMYSDVPGGTPHYTFHIGDEQCGTYSSEGDCYNREHSWPQSWFNDQTTPRTDLHHVFATDGYVNNRRGNYPFGEVRSATYISSNGSKLGSCATSGYSETVFEPIDEYKGDFARAIFYMSVRYYSEDDGWSSSGMTSRSTILPWALNMLLRWNENDPVSQKEIDRNNAVYEIQGNRNPFVDNQDYAPMIWDPNWTGTTYIVSLSAGQGGSIIPSGSVTVNSENNLTFTVTPYDCYEISSVTVNGSSVALNANNSYTIQNITKNTTVMVTFTSVGSFTINASASYGGSISPVGESIVNCGGNMNYVITPDENFIITNVIVDGQGKGAVLTYSFDNVTENHTISASFVEDGITACEPPVHITTNVNQNNVVLLWEVVPGATDYEIFRNGANIAMVSGTTSYEDNSLEIGQYCYTIVAYCIEGSSSLSSEICADVVFIGLDEVQNEKIGFSPNPIGSGEVLRLSNGISFKIDHVSICDLSGRTVLLQTSEQTSGLSVIIPEHLTSGLYMLRLFSGAQTVETLKLVVK
jgi:Endonuclease I